MPDPISHLDEIQQAYQQMVSIEIWKKHKNSLFAVHPYIWKEGKLIDPFESLEELHPPIPNSWLVKHHLEYWNPNLLQMDLKGDGFTVLENYQTNTHPTDPHVHPPLHIKLRLKKSICIPFRIKFSGTPDEGKTFALNAMDVPCGQTQFLRLGESFLMRNKPYLVKSYHPKIQVNEMGLEIDMSELVLESNEEKIILCLDRAVNFPSFYALFQFFEEELKVEKGELFTLKGRENYPYRLLKMSDIEALIEVVTTGEKYEVPKL